MADRQINFAINISRSDQNVFRTLIKEFQQFRKEAGAANRALAAMSKISTNATNVTQAASAFNALSDAIAKVATSVNAVDLTKITAMMRLLKTQGELATGQIKALQKQMDALNATRSQKGAKDAASAADKEVKAQAKVLENISKVVNARQNELTQLRNKIRQSAEAGEADASAARKMQTLSTELRKLRVAGVAAVKSLEEQRTAGANLDKNTLNLIQSFDGVKKAINSEIVSIQNSNQTLVNAEKVIRKFAVANRQASAAAISAWNKYATELQRSMKVAAAATKTTTGQEAARTRVADASAQLGKLQAAGAPSQVIDAQRVALDRATESYNKYSAAVQLAQIAVEKQKTAQQAALTVTQRIEEYRGALLKQREASIRALQNVEDAAAQRALANAQKEVKAARQRVQAAREVYAVEAGVRKSAVERMVQANSEAAKSATAAANAQKNASKVANQAAREQANAQRQAAKAAAANAKATTNFADQIAKGFNNVIASQLKYLGASFVVFRLIQRIREAFESIIEVSDRVAKAFAVSRSAILGLEERYDALGDSIESTAIKMGRSIKDVSEILFQFGSAGLQAEESMAALQSTMRLIIATDADVTATTKTVAGVYRLLGNQLDYLGTQTQKFARINDVLAATYRDNQVELNELNQGLKFALPVAKQLNLSFEQVSGILATLQNNMIRAGEAGRSLRSIFSRMSSQSEEFAEAFGIALDPDKPLSFIDMLEKLQSRMSSGALTVDQVGTVFERFGLRGANSFLVLTQQFDSLSETIRKLEEDSQGAAATMARVRIESIAGQVNKFKETVLELARDALLPLGAIIFGLIEAFNDFYEVLQETGLDKYLKIILAITTALIAIKIATVAWTVVTKLQTLWLIRQQAAVIGSVVAQHQYIRALHLSTVGVYTNIKALFSMSGALGVLAGVLQTVATAMITAFPYVLIGAAIALIIYWIYRMRNEYRLTIEENNKRLEQIREEIRQRRHERDALDRTISKLEEVNQASAEGRANLITQNRAISEAVSAHGELALAAAESGGNLAVFTQKAREQRQVVQEAMEVLQREQVDKFGESIKLQTKFLQDSADQYELLQDQIANYKGQLAGTIPIQFQSNQAMSARAQAQLALTNAENKLAGVMEEARKTQRDMSKSVQENIKIMPQFVDVLKDASQAASRLYATDRPVKAFGDFYSFLQRSVNQLSEFPIQAKISELNDKIVRGLESLKFRYLFEFDVVIPDSVVDDAEAEVARVFKESTRLLKESQELSTIELDQFIDVDFAESDKKIQMFADTIQEQLRESTKGLGLKELIAFDEEQGEELFTAITENIQLLPSAFEEGSEAAEKFYNNAKTIQNIQDELIAQVEKQDDAGFYLIQNEEDRKQVIDGIKGLYGDMNDLLYDGNLTQEELVEYADRIFNLSKQTLLAQNAVNGIYAQQLAIRRAYNLALGQAESISDNILYDEKQSLNVIGQKVQLAEKELEAANERVERIKESGPVLQAALDAQKEAQSVVLGLTAEQAAQTKKVWDTETSIARTRTEAIGALDREYAFGQARSSQLKAQLSLSRRLEKIRIRRINKIDDERKRRATAEAERRKFIAARFALNRQILEAEQQEAINFATRLNAALEIFKADDKILKSENRLLIVERELAFRREKIAELESRRNKNGKVYKNLVADIRTTEGEINTFKREQLSLEIGILETRTEYNATLNEQVSSLESIRLKLVQSSLIQDRNLANVYEENILNAKIAATKEKISFFNEKLSRGLELNTDEQLKYNDLIDEYAGLLSEDILRDEGELEKIKKQQLAVQDKINSTYDKELGYLAEIRGEIEGATSSLLQQRFGDAPFSAMQDAARALGKSIFEIQALGPQKTIELINKGLREGTLSADNFTGKMHEFARALSVVGEEERKIREIQEDIKRQRFETAIIQLQAALDAGNIEKASKALDDMGNSAEVLNPRTGKVDYRATLENFEKIRIAGGLIGDELAESGGRLEAKLEVSRDRAEQLLQTVEKHINTITKALSEGKFLDGFVDSMNTVISQLKRLEGTTITFEVKEYSGGTATRGYQAGFFHGQDGGGVPGQGRGDIVQAMLEPGEFVIPRSVVGVLGSDFFEQFRDPNFVNALSRSGQGLRGVFGNIPGIDRPSAYTSSNLVPGEGLGDIIPARLAEGDFVIPRWSVQTLGTEFFGRLIDPELIKKLSAANISRLKNELGYEQFANVREDLLNENRRAIGYKHGGLVSLSGIRGYADGGTAIKTTGVSQAEAETYALLKMTFDDIEISYKGPSVAEQINDVVFKDVSVDIDPMLAPIDEVGEKIFSISKITAPKVEIVDPKEAENVANVTQETEKLTEAIDQKNQATGESGQYTADVKQSLELLFNTTVATEEGANAQEVFTAAVEQTVVKLKNVVGAISAFRAQVKAAQGPFVELAGKMLDAFGSKMEKAIDNIAGKFSNLFSKQLPGLFGTFVKDFVLAGAEVVAANEENQKDIIDSFRESRVALVEQLKRNEISYFDYFNKLEDLAADRDKAQAESAEDVTGELRDVYEDFTKNFFSEFTGLLTDMVSGFNEFFDDIIDGMVGLADNVFSVFGDIGGAVGNIFGETGMAAGSVVGGVLGEAMGSIFSAVGSIASAFTSVISSAVQGILSIIPYIVELGMMGEDEIKGMLDSFREAPAILADIGEGFVRNLPLVAKALEDNFPTIATAFVDMVIKIIGSIADILRSDFIPVFVGTILDAFVDIVQALPDLFQGIFVSIAETFGNIFSGDQLSTLADAVQSTISTVIQIIVSGISDLVIPILQSIVDALPAIVTAIGSAVVAEAPQLMDAVTALMDTFVNMFKDPAVLSKLQEAVVGMFAGLGDMGGDGGQFGVLFESITGFLESMFEVLPTMIEGGVAVVNTFMALAPIIIDVLTIVQQAIYSILPPIATLLAELVGSFSKIFSAIVPTIISLIDIIADAVGQLMPIITPILTAIVDAFLPLVEAFMGLLDAVIEPLGELLMEIIPILGEMFANYMGPAIIILEVLIDVLVDIIDVVTAIIPVVLNALIPIFKVVMNMISLMVPPLTELVEALAPLLEIFIKAGIATAFVVLIAGFIEILVLGIPIIQSLMPLLMFSVRVLIYIVQVTGTLVAALQGLTALFTRLADVFTGLKEKATEAIDKFSFLSKVFDAIQKVLYGNSLIPVLELLYDVFKAISDFIANTFMKVFETMQQGLKTISDFIENTFVTAFDSLSDAFSDIFDLISDIVGIIPTPGDATDSTSNVVDTAKNVGETIADGVKDGVSNAVGALKDLTPWHAGGIFQASDDPGAREFHDFLGLRGDEGLALLQNGEGILTRAGVKAIGGVEVLDELNAGGDSMRLPLDGGGAQIPAWMIDVPTFHVGGVFEVATDAATQEFNRMLGLRADEGLALLQNGEGILTRTGVEAIGGADAVNAANKNEFAVATFADNPGVLGAHTQTVRPIGGGGPEPAGGGGGGGGGGPVTIQVNVDMSGSNFQSETIAEDVENSVADMMSNGEGRVYEEVNNVAGNDEPEGIRYRS